MSTPTNSTTDVPALMNRIKKTFEETFEDVSSAKDVKKMIDHLMNQLPYLEQWEQKLRQLDAYNKIKSSEFRSIRKELAKIDEELRQAAADADRLPFKALSEEELNDIDSKEGEEHPLLKSLQVSYEFWKHDPRICLFLAIFPEEVVLKKRFLIYWWIGEGFVQDEVEGEKVFKDLLDLELLIPYPTDKRDPRVSKCQVFPWIRYMLISEGMKEKLLSLDNNIPCFNTMNSRRACLISDRTNLARDLRESMLESLKTIINVNERELNFQHQWFAKLKNLVVLQLGRWQDSPTHHIEVGGESFLPGLKTQKFLKYLSLRGISRITSLPESIRELVSLEILDLKACHNLETLPTAVSSLKKLTHLDLSECYLLDGLPKGLDKLTSLQVFKGFMIGSSMKTPIRVKNLTSLEKLKRLSIHIGSEASIQKDEFDKLKDLKEVKCLKISWGKTDLDEEYSLYFPPELQKLDLEGIPHEQMPEWLKPNNLNKLKNLKTLYIKGGKLTDLLDQEQYKNVEYLVIKYTKNMERVNKKSPKKVFPSLQYAKKVEWEGEREIVQEYDEWNEE